MLSLEWNALRIGDHVLVHDDADSELSLDDGVVVLTERSAGSNDVAVRVTRPGRAPRLVRPRSRAVHLRPVDVTQPCWRCDVAAVSSASRALNGVSAP